MHVLEFPWNFWLILGCSVASDALYAWGLVNAYKLLDMSAAYPMMRAMPLLLTALVTSLFGLGDALSPMAIIGMAVVFVGCLCMPLKSFSDFNIRSYLSVNMFFVLVTACGTTGYTIFDSMAQDVLKPIAESMNVSKPVMSITYYSTRGITLTSTLTIITLLVSSERQKWIGFIKELNYRPFLAGIFASATYVSVLIAMNYVTNVSFVQVFRQMGLVIALFFGIFILKEKGTLPKFIGVGLILSGLVISVF
jgi:drug/metabolite transporter (DMT)-like permease